MLVPKWMFGVWVSFSTRYCAAHYLLMMRVFPTCSKKLNQVECSQVSILYFLGCVIDFKIFRNIDYLNAKIIFTILQTTHDRMHYYNICSFLAHCPLLYDLQEQQYTILLHTLIDDIMIIQKLQHVSLSVSLSLSLTHSSDSLSHIYTHIYAHTHTYTYTHTLPY